jgi:Uma2 family endonuclease
METMTSGARKKATREDLRAAYGEDGRAEIINGVIVEKSVPTDEQLAGQYGHSSAQYGLILALGRRFGSAVGGKWPGGWLLRPEIHVQYADHDLFCHDFAGWRRERMTTRLDGWPIELRPDWVLEVLSPGHKRRDRFEKWRVLHRAGVPHYWLIDHEIKTLEVYRWHPDGFLNVLQATAGQTVRAAPFDAVELRVNVLLGEEDDDPES